MTPTTPNEVEYDYANQAWTRNGVYEPCGHPPEMDCQCYGRLHAGETAPKQPPTLDSVCHELRVIGHTATVVDTGGGCTAISVDEGKAIVGNSCGWGADLYVDDEWTRSVNLHEDVKSTDDAQQIAATLHQSILASHCSTEILNGIS